MGIIVIAGILLAVAASFVLIYNYFFYPDKVAAFKNQYTSMCEKHDGINLNKSYPKSFNNALTDDNPGATLFGQVLYCNDGAKQIFAMSSHAAVIRTSNELSIGRRGGPHLQEIKKDLVITYGVAEANKILDEVVSVK